MRSLLVPAGMLVGVGLVALSSISRQLFVLQMVWAAAGVAFLMFFRFVDWRTLLNYRWFVAGLYVLSLALLLAVLVSAPTIRATKSWLIVGPVHLQPVEIAKVALILLYARFFSRRHVGIARWEVILSSFALFALPMALVLAQPDLGSALVLFGIWFGFLLVSGLPRRRLVIALICLAVIAAVGWQWFLKDYHRARILGVFYPESNALTVNYSVIQSKIAIGSAGWWGKGYGQGAQTQLGFLTEPSSDFILAAVIEEWGILAGLLVIAAFLYLIWRVLGVGLRARENFERFACLGAAIVWGIHFFVNSGSTVGIFPVVGIPFPFLSYGGSHLLLDFFLLGLVYGIARKS